MVFLMPLEDLKRAFERAISRFSDRERTLLSEAASLMISAHENQKRMNGEPYATHPLGVALLLCEWGADADTVIAGLLHDTLEDTGVTYDGLKASFGAAVADLVEGVTKFTQADFAGQEQFDRKIETLRKLFEVMRSDVRVAIVKLADRLHNTRTIGELPTERRKRFASETMDVYYKIAMHLGMNAVRRELSEHCMPVLLPRECADVIAKRDRELAEQESVVREMERTLRAHDKSGSLLMMEVKPRSLHSILKISTEEDRSEPLFLYVVRARDTDGCYELLKLFHTLYKPISGRFRDYIAVPTESAYRSIRTAVIGPGNTLIPVRIRTQEMHDQEKSGILLKCFSQDAAVPGFGWLKRLEQTDEQSQESSEAFWETLQSDILQENIKVSVNGEDRFVPKGCTVLDAVLAEYGEEGARVGHVMVNGTERSLGHIVEQDDLIAVKLTSRSHLTFEWSAIASTALARNLITKSLRKRGKEEKLLVGQRLLQRELDRFRRGLVGELSRPQREAATHRYKRETFEEVLTMIGEGVVRARDVFFAIFPESGGRTLFMRKAEPSYAFRIRVRGIQGARRSNLAHLLTLARALDITVHGTKTRYDARGSTYVSQLRGIAPDRLHFADLLAAIERQEHVSGVDSLASRREKLILSGAFLLALAVIIGDVQVLIPALMHSAIPHVAAQAAALLPIIMANHFLLRTLEHYIVTIRSDTYYIGLGFLMNLFGVILVIRAGETDAVAGSILPVVAVFAFSMLYLAYRFFQTETAFTGLHHERKPLSGAQWQVLKTRKIAGYSYRLGAVCVWGITPIYLRYSPISELAPFMRVFFMSIGAALFTAIALSIKRLTAPKDNPIALTIHRNRLLALIIVTQAVYMYFSNTSLARTSSTNFLLFQNFAPVFALMVAAVLWRETTPYMQNPKNMLRIFLVFIMGSVGSSLVIYNSIRGVSEGSLSGDMLGLVSMTFDTVVIIAQIRYMKAHNDASGLAINLTMFGLIALCMLPVVAALSLSGLPGFALPTLPVVFACGAGVLFGIGLLLNYEAFRRIDGFIAFLMFNLSILITFVLEVFVLRRFEPTALLVLGGITIVGSTVLAELINSKCQKEGY